MRSRMIRHRRATHRRLFFQQLESRQMLSTIDFVQESVDLNSISLNSIDFGQPVVPIYTDNNAWGAYMSSVDADGVELDANDPNVDPVSGGTQQLAHDNQQPGDNWLVSVQPRNEPSPVDHGIW